MVQMLKSNPLSTKIANLQFRRQDKVKFKGMRGHVVCVDISKGLIECNFSGYGIYYFNLDGSLNDILQNNEKLEKLSH